MLQLIRGPNFNAVMKSVKPKCLGTQLILQPLSA